MTKFDELMQIITRNKNKGKARQQSTAIQEENNNDNDLEVAGTESTKNPIIDFGDNQTDPDLLDQLRFNPKYKPNQGFADRWDLD